MLLDAPGVLPMRLADQTAAVRLAICNDIGEVLRGRRISPPSRPLQASAGLCRPLQASAGLCRPLQASAGRRLLALACPP